MSELSDSRKYEPTPMVRCFATNSFFSLLPVAKACLAGFHRAFCPAQRLLVPRRGVKPIFVSREVYPKRFHRAQLLVARHFLQRKNNGHELMVLFQVGFGNSGICVIRLWLIFCCCFKHGERLL